MINKSTAISMAGRVLSDTLLIVLLGIPVVLIEMDVIKPRMQGFHCGDNSITLPKEDEILPVKITYPVVVVTTFIIIVIMELIKWFCEGDADSKQDTPTSVELQRYKLAANVYTVILIIVHGFLINQLTSDVIKVSYGALRPYFLAVCIPKGLDKLCASRANYVKAEKVICTSKMDEGTIFEARRSCPLTEASLCICYAIFVTIYLQSRFMWNGPVSVIKHVLQIGMVNMGLIFAFSKVGSEHHLMDALIGIVIGVVVGVAMFLNLKCRLAEVENMHIRLMLPESQNKIEMESGLKAVVHATNPQLIFTTDSETDKSPADS